MDAARTRELWTHLWLPLIAFAAAISTIASLHLDWALAHTLFTWQDSQWALRKAFVTETLIHKLGHDLSIAAWVCVLLVWLLSLKRISMQAWRKPLGYLLLSVLASTLLITWIKSWSNMDCPWDMTGLGGHHPYLTLFTERPDTLPHSKCFPAGHASGGYAWMALYFFFLMSRPSLRWYGLAAGLGAGLLFGIGQQLRGAHFLSHDLWTATICWVVAFAVYRIFRRLPAPDRLVVSLRGRPVLPQLPDRLHPAADAQLHARGTGGPTEPSVVPGDRHADPIKADGDTARWLRQPLNHR